MIHLTPEMIQGVAQGEILLLPCAKIPDEAKPVQPVDGYHIVAHSETGHHHRVLGKHVNMLVMDDFTSYLDVTESTDLVHMRDHDTHETINLAGGSYMVRHARESLPEPPVRSDPDMQMSRMVID